MKILIVVPQYKPRGQFYELPIGLGYVSSFLKREGFDVTFVNANEEILRRDPAAAWFDEIVRDHDVLCTGGLSVHYHQVRSIIRAAKLAKPGITAIIGGGLVSSEPDLMLGALGADYGIIGEGERTILTILNEIEHPGLFPKFGKIRGPIEIDDLDDIPYPDYDGLGVAGYLDRQMQGDEHYTYPVNYPRALPVISSRSCPFSCSFCFHPCGQKYRQRSVDNFAAEVEHYISLYNINILTVLDELISADIGRLEKICAALKKLDILWMAQMRVDNITLSLMRLLKESGCFQISFGIESASDQVLQSMNKHTTLKQIENALALTYEAGIGIQGNILFGDPSETRASALETLKWWEQNVKYGINLTYVIPYPGSKLYEDAVSYGKIRDRLTYIEGGCPFVKLNNEVSRYGSDIEEYRRCLNHIPAIDYDIRKIGQDAYRGDLYRIKATCPHCNNISIYENLYFGATGAAFLSNKGYRIGCMVCNRRFDLPKEYFK